MFLLILARHAPNASWYQAWCEMFPRISWTRRHRSRRTLATLSERYNDTDIRTKYFTGSHSYQDDMAWAPRQ
jgi:hypothetical protein